MVVVDEGVVGVGDVVVDVCVGIDCDVVGGLDYCCVGLVVIVDWGWFFVWEFVFEGLVVEDCVECGGNFVCVCWVEIGVLVLVEVGEVV